MLQLKVGDIVKRKSYGGDIPFVITGIKIDANRNPVFTLRGMFYRIEADCDGDDLLISSSKEVYADVKRNITETKKYARQYDTQTRIFINRYRSKVGKILHIDSSSDLMGKCVEHYKEAKVRYNTILADESEQPGIVRRSLQQYSPDILIVTGHDAMKKNSSQSSLDSYRTSQYFIQSVKEARKYQPDFDKLCVYAGACQSYYEGIMAAGANFASSPGRILINGLDPALVAEKVALTDSRYFVTPQMVAQITITGSKGIGGINTRGHLIPG